MSRSAKLVQELYRVACQPDKGFDFQVNELIRLGCELFDMEAGIVSKISGPKHIVEHVVSPLVPIERGKPVPSMAVLGMRSHLQTEIKSGDEVIGKIIFARRRPLSDPVSQEEADILGLMAVWLSREIERLEREQELVAATKKMSVLVKFDALTGLYSRPSIEGRLKRLLQRSQYTSEPISAAVIDIDDFSRIEMRYGSAGADMAITAVAQAIDETVRPTDPSARIGDDEFLVILVGANESQARMVAERVREKIKNSYIDISGAKVPLSASIAVTELSEEIVHIEEILKDTHARLMLAKQKGKGRVL